MGLQFFEKMIENLENGISEKKIDSSIVLNGSKFDLSSFGDREVKFIQPLIEKMDDLVVLKIFNPSSSEPGYRNEDYRKLYSVTGLRFVRLSQSDKVTFFGYTKEGQEEYV